MNWDVAIYETFSRLETRWLVNTRLDLDPDFYDYNAWPMADFMASVEMVGQFVPQGRFLDVGCGIGTKLALMYSLGWEVSGLDWNQEYVFRARELLPERADAIVVADLRDVESFDADVVYMYRPAKSDEQEEAVERHLIGHCAQGTLLILPETPVTSQLDLERVGPNVWRV